MKSIPDGEAIYQFALQTDNQLCDRNFVVNDLMTSNITGGKPRNYHEIVLT